MKRTIFLLTRDGRNDSYTWEECDSQTLLNNRLHQNPLLKLGITATFEELGEPPYQFPILVRWLRPHQAIIDTNPELGDESICLLELKVKPDIAMLQNCTLEEALGLCETYDTYAPV